MFLEHLVHYISHERLVVDEKKHILQDEFSISMTRELSREVLRMCNLSDGVERKGIEKGIK